MSVQIPDYTNPYLRTASSGSSGPGALGDNTPAKASNDSDKDTEGTDGTSGSNDVIDAVFGDASDKAVSMDDFLTLMVAQLKNQDFMNPVDDTQYVTQLAQISTMQQMEEMAYNAKSTYVTSLVGKTVTAAKFTVAGDLKKTEGIVNRENPTAWMRLWRSGQRKQRRMTARTRMQAATGTRTETIRETRIRRYERL